MSRLKSGHFFFLLSEILFSVLFRDNLMQQLKWDTHMYIHIEERPLL